MKTKQKIQAPKKFTYAEAYEMAKKDNTIVFISEVTKDKYRVEIIDHQEKIRFFGTAINNWQNCVFILAAELVGSWNIEKDGEIIKEIVEI